MLRLIALAVGAIAVVGANWLFWSLPNRPYDLEARPLGLIRSVSFAPFRDGQSPLVERYPSRAEIEEDLTLLKGRVLGVRTYTSREGLEVVPEIARRLGLEVTMSAWIGSDLKINELEVESLIRLANAYPDVIKRVIVGNEVLLRKELKPEALAAYIRRVRAAVQQPVSYADVWEFWQRNPALAREVDFITIHILPYWENHPSSVDDLQAHVMEAYREIQATFPGKTLLIGEAGWPSAGRSRGPAVPTLVNKARFINGFRVLAAEQGVDYNLIEAFDQKWKAKLEGTVGANWGLFSSDRVAKWGVDGKVVENRDWRIHFAITSVAALLLLGWIAFARPRPTAHGVLWAAAGAQLVATSSLVAVWSEWLVAYSTYRLFWTAFVAIITVVTAWTLVQAFRRLGAPATPGAATPGWARRLGRLHAGWAMLAVGHTLLLVYDGRYRDFPNLIFALPLLGGALLVAARYATGRAAGVAGLAIDGLYGPGSGPRIGGDCRALLVAAAVAGAFALVIGETPANREALIWAAMTVAITLPFAAGMRLGARAPTPAWGTPASIPPIPFDKARASEFGKID